MKLIIVEDQALVRGAIGSLLSLEADMDVVGLAENGKQALSLLEQRDVDLVLTDIEMPEMTGLELAEVLRKDYPSINTVIMTTFSKSGYIKRGLNLGIKAFVLKEAPTDYLVDALRRVQLGEKVIDPELALLAIGDDDPLTDKERVAVRLAGDGLKTTEIASKLFLSEGTVRNYLSEAISKLNATNRIDAARIARQKGWI